MIGVGLLGSGFIAESYADALLDVRNAELVACYSRNPARSDAFAKKWKVTAHATMDGSHADHRPLQRADIAADHRLERYDDLGRNDDRIDSQMRPSAVRPDPAPNRLHS